MISLVNVQLQKLDAHPLSEEAIPIAPVHFYVLCGILMKCPPEPWSKSIVTTTASRVAVLSIPECVVGEPLAGKWVMSGRFAIEVLSHK